MSFAVEKKAKLTPLVGKMKGLEYYYPEFQRTLDVYDLVAGKDFRSFSQTHTPREVFLWLEQRSVDNCLPSPLAELLADFYWEIS